MRLRCFQRLTGLVLGAAAVGSVHAQMLGPNPSNQLPVTVPSVVSRSIILGHTDPARTLHISVSLPYGDPQGMQAYCDGVSDPRSPNYRHFLTPETIGHLYGLPANQVQAVVDHLKTNGLSVVLVAKNHLTVMVDGTVAQAERAFGTRINDYLAKSPSEAGSTQYYSFSTPLHLPTSIAGSVIDVTGLESFTKPQPRALTATQTRTLYNTAPIYGAGQQGQGRIVGISNFDGYRLTNVPLYYSQFSLPTPPGGVNSNVHEVKISGGAGTGTPQGEGDLDIQMVLGMAPLCEFYIYDGGASDLIGTLTREVNDNLADVITESYGWNLPTSTANSAHNLHLSMTAQGITYMAASGDSGTTVEPYSYPNYDPEVLMVGGTIATVNGSGVRTSEVGWSGSGGGWSTKAVTFNTRPSWQAGTGVPTNINFRMSPDVSLNASGSGTGAYQFYFNGALTSGYVGTSFACPVFGGALALAEQKIIGLGGLPPNGAGKRRFGRIQDLLYSQNGRTDVWFDITSGSNGTLPNGQTSSCTAKWDMVTGWGAINFDAFVSTQVSVGVPNPPTGLGATAGNAQVTLTWTPSSSATSYNVKRATVSGGPYSTVGSSTTTSFTNTGLTNGTTYYYVVTAVNSAGESGNSNEASATPNLSIPNAPTGLSATAGNAQVSLSWTGSGGATSYNVKRATVSGGPYSTVGSTASTSFVNTGLTNGTTYYYVVTAVNSAGESGNSNQASATPSGGGAQQLMLNPGFESGSVNWTATAGVITNSASQAAHGGTWKGWLDGYGSTHTDSLYQQVAVPSTANTATLTFYLHIDSAETTTTVQYDKLQVQIRNSSNTVLATLATYSNLNKAAGYSLKTFDVSAYRGQTIRVYLLGTEDSSLQTSFVVDDFALNVN
ncbi:MAG: fibronectin type III domain-containing protein [Armatimonadetes bacterium]|nr:fibronectin type III domain-containing protein [Armatimonadota bacterium]